MIIAALIDQLTKDPRVTDLVSNRVHAAELPQGSHYPAIVLTLVDEVPLRELDGDTPNCAARVQIEVWAEGYADLCRVVYAVRQALVNKRFTYDGRKIGPSYVVNLRDIPSLQQQAHPAIRGRSLDFIVYGEH